MPNKIIKNKKTKYFHKNPINLAVTASLIFGLWVLMETVLPLKNTFVFLKTNEVRAAINLVQTVNGTAENSTSVSVSFTNTSTADNLIVAICASRDNSTLSISNPAGFSTAVNTAGTPSQGIFYKVADGTETTITCTSSVKTELGLHIYEYSGTDPDQANVLDGVAVSNTGTGTSITTNSVTTNNANDILIAGVVVNSDTVLNDWLNSFVERNDFTNGGRPKDRSTYGGADNIVASIGDYSTGVTAGASGAWRADLVAFKEAPTVIGPATWREPENTPTQVGIGENIRLRIAIANATGTAALGYDFRLEYASKVGDICGDDENFISVPVTAGIEHFEMVDSPYFANGDPTTQKLSNPEGYNFISGKMVEDPANNSGQTDLQVEEYTEYEFVFQANSQASGFYCFRLTNAGFALDDYTIFPELEVMP